METPDVTIRDATLADAPALAAVQIAGWRAAYPGIVPDEFLAGMDAAEYTARWEKFLSQPTLHTLVVEVDDRIGAYCAFGPARDADSDRSRVGEIYAVYVHPDHWRNGLGRCLCLSALSQFQSAGSVAVTLWVAEANARAQRFYNQLGFNDDGGRKIESAGAPIRHLRYRRIVAPESPFKLGVAE